MSTVQEPKGPRQRRERPRAHHHKANLHHRLRWQRQVFIKKGGNVQSSGQIPPMPPINPMPPCCRRPRPRPAGSAGHTCILARIRMESHGTIRITARRRAPHIRGPGAAAPYHLLAQPYCALQWGCLLLTRINRVTTPGLTPGTIKRGLGRPANRYISQRVYRPPHSRTTDSMPCMCNLLLGRDGTGSKWEHRPWTSPGWLALVGVHDSGPPSRRTAAAHAWFRAAK